MTTNTKGTFASIHIGAGGSTEESRELHPDAQNAQLQASGQGTGVVTEGGASQHRRKLSIQFGTSPAQTDIDAGMRAYEAKERELGSLLDAKGNPRRPELYHRVEVLRNRLASIRENLELQVAWHESQGSDQMMEQPSNAGGLVQVNHGDLVEFMQSLPEDDPLRIKFEKQNAAALRRKYRL